jgi:preprotein translocase subunit SecF
MELPNIYKGNYKRLIIIPIILVLFFLFFIPSIKPGIELKGGVQITFETPVLKNADVLEQAVMDEGFIEYTVKTYVLGETNVAEIEIGHSEEILNVENSYRDFLTNYDLYSKKQYELLLMKNSNASYTHLENEVNDLHDKLIQNRNDFEEYSEFFLGVKTNLPQDVDAIKPDVEDLYSKIISSYRSNIISKLSPHIDYNSYSFKLINPSLSEIFLEKIQSVMIFAGILMAITVYIMFRDVYPTVTILIGVLFDVLFALGAMGLLGIPLSLASIAAILMLIGYSVDTNILLTIRVLKRGFNNPRDSAHDAMKTGLMLTFTGILSFLALFMVSQITNIATYQTISLVVLFGLFGDLFATWLLNAVLILHRAEGVKDA